MDLQLFSNQLDYTTFREIEKDGKTWLVINGVPLVEGVLNGFLVPYDEFSACPYDWNDMPIVLNHPSENNGSARVSSPDVPVIGRFHNTTVDNDGRRLTGESWLDKDVFLATDSGPDLYEKMKQGQPIEISTGYFAPGTTPDHGKFNGKDYQGIHKGIHPDHIAILTDQIGACSLMDGCGLNRNSAKTCDCAACNKSDCPDRKVVANMTGNLPTEGKKIFEEVYKKSKAGGKDEETAAKIAWGAVKRAGWSLEDDKWVKQNQQSADESLDWFAKAKSVLTKEFLMQNKVLKAFLHTLGFDKVTIEDEGEGLSLKLEGTGDEKALEGLMQLNTVVTNSGGASEFAKTLETLKALPATVTGMQQQMSDALNLIKNASAFAESAATKAEAAKKGLITGLVQNKACPFDEATLNTMSLDVLEKLDTSYQLVDYSGLGAGLFHNSGDDKPLALPKAFLAKTEPVKAEA